MMVNTMDMSAPVTRGELREELDRAFEERLAPFATKADLEPFATKADLEPLVTKDYLEERLKNTASKEDLNTWGGALFEKLKDGIAALGKELRNGLKEDFKGMKDELKAELKEELTAALSAEFAQHVRSMEDTFRKQVSTFDDKYKDLPGRVHRLEGAVFSNDKSGDTPEDKPGAKAESKKGRRSVRPSTPARSPKRR